VSLSFVALDVETANAARSSICQIGLVRVKDGTIGESYCELVDPESFFDEWNVGIHGISSSLVAGKPKFVDIAQRIADFVGGEVVVSHTAFDRAAIQQAYARYGLVPPCWPWLDSAAVSRRAWTALASSGYGLADVAAHCGIELRNHHDALEDARVTALIFSRAIEETGLDIEAWRHRVTQPIDPQAAVIRRDGDPLGPLHGEVVVFTGTLSMSRSAAAALAASLGCDVRDSVTRSTTTLVVGQQDLSRLAGFEKSGKHRKAEDLIAQGAKIAIIGENDFVHFARPGGDGIGR
jgi:DNA polymerase III subunit epsilon